GELDELKSIVVRVQTRPSIRIAIDGAARAAARSVFGVERSSIGTFLAEGRLAHFLSPIGHRGNISSAEGVGDAVPTPHAGQILGIERMVIEIEFFRRLCPIEIVLATRARLPARWRRNGGALLIGSEVASICCAFLSAT